MRYFFVCSKLQGYLADLIYVAKSRIMIVQQHIHKINVEADGLFAKRNLGEAAGVEVTMEV